MFSQILPKPLPAYIAIGLTLLAFVAPSPADDSTPAPPRTDFVSPETLSTIAFGSCSKQDLPQPIWSAIVQNRPDLFIYMGDNIYGDTEDMQVLAAKYAQQKAVPGYTQLRGLCPVIGTWDDHDFGKNDAGAEYPFKRESQQLMLDFFDEPATSPRRQREGVYASYLYGPAGRRVQVILLDTRYFRTPLTRGINLRDKAEGFTGPYVNSDDPAGDMLGPQQWTWLAEQLQVPAELRLVVSSIQVLPDEHGWEKWGNMIPQRQRLLDLLAGPEVNGVILLSGDRHAAEFCRLDREQTYPLWEATSSSLNRPREFVNEVNRYRVGLLYPETNFGLLTVNWDAAEPEVKLQIRSETGIPALQVRVPLKDLHKSTGPGE